MIIPANYKKINTFAHMDAYISDMCWIDEKVDIDEGTNIYHFTVLRSNVKIGKNVVIGHNCTIERDTTIGNNTIIQSNTHITGEAKIGKNVFIGPGVTFCNERDIATHGRTTPKIEGPTVLDGARIGAGCLICPGVIVGKNSFVLAGTRVTKHIPDGEVWGPREDGKAKKIHDVPDEQMI
jgi:UDP-2-acetamido-3-amino-2,3-dideoxy-glucuronate N-acetyltransferase